MQQQQPTLKSLTKNIEELKQQLALKDWRWNLILDHIPLLFFYCDKDGIFEVLQGDGMSKALMLHNPTTLYDLFNDFPSMFARAEANDTGHFRDDISVAPELSLAIEYQLTKGSQQEVNGIVGFVHALSIRKHSLATSAPTATDSKVTALETNADKERLLELLKSEDNKLNFELIKSGLKKILEFELEVKMSDLLINRTKTRLSAS
ncbi:MAG: hypothetical protein AAF738_04270 [Bacteroidota bacterium]